MGCDQGIDLWLTTTNVVIRNNMIVPGAMNSMYITDGTGTQVCNNTVFSVFTTNNGAIIFNNSTGVTFKNNIVYGSLVQNGTVTIDTGNNIFLTRTNRLAAAAWFGDESMGDLHLKSDTCAPVNAGISLAGVSDDWDGVQRTGPYDIGADEYAVGNGILPQGDLGAAGLVVSQASPNPFNPATRVRYSISESMQGKLFSIKVHAASGVVIKTLASGIVLSGTHDVVWDGTDNVSHPVASGIYWIVVQCGAAQKSVRAVLWK
ncbi:MAG: hypothetical protein A2350_20825 [Candidatus Raymondbacteria bacterium RifOxyB12_full_50_8]|nr:MAG: hypothetical protein A2350_20825 [Candidatus Raymondbacteria bacterium RifOxyB12_full_50_8]